MVIQCWGEDKVYIIEKIKDYENYYIDTNGIIYTSYILGDRGKISNTIRPLKYGYDKIF